MFAEHLSETMRRFVHELKLNHQRKQADGRTGAGNRLHGIGGPDSARARRRSRRKRSSTKPRSVRSRRLQTPTPKAVAADASGNHVAVWSSQNADGSWSVNAQRFNSAGIAQGDQIQVSSQTSLDQQHATVSMNANGSFVITWTNDNPVSGSADIYARQFNRRRLAQRLGVPGQ